MKDIHEMLRQKEQECARLREEVEALRITAPLLDPEGAAAYQGEATETLDEMIARERASSAQVISPEAANAEVSGESVPSDSVPDDERKGPLSENQTQTSWWRRLQSGT